MLIPRDPLDGKDVIVEVKSGEGGEESALFAGDLVRMYLRFAEKKGWKAELIDAIAANAKLSKADAKKKAASISERNKK